MSRTIVVLEGDQTGQELLEEALRVLDPAVTRVDAELERYDLSLESRRETGNEVVTEAARAMRDAGFAASVDAVPVGEQLCQQHCPVSHVAHEFPQLCEAETEVIAKVLGRHVQRLATIAHGDGVCTTCIPARVPGARPVAATAAPTNVSSDERLSR